MSEVWVVNASPIICLAKAGYLQLLDHLGIQALIPEAVVREVESGPGADPARKALESGWGERADPIQIPETVLEWGLGSGETAVLSLVLESQNRLALVDDGAARKCASALGVKVLGTLAVVLRAKRDGLIPSASSVLVALLRAGLRLDESVLRAALERGAGERWPSHRDGD